MREANLLNATLERRAPGAGRCLSPVGRAAAFPKGIPYQAAQAKGAEINVTIGEMTDGRGGPLPLPTLAKDFSSLDQRLAFLYGPIEGHLGTREAWLARQRRIANDATEPASRPITTHGLTHGLSIIAALFADPDTTVVLPSPYWDNYPLLFTLFAQARVVSFPFFDAEGRGFNVDGLADTLAQIRGKAILILNFPGNPTGYMPSPAEVARIAEVVAAHPSPMVTVCDDAYQGYVYDEVGQRFSPYWALAARVDPERALVVKVDGATKELVFFASRVGFLSHTATEPEAETAMLSKLKTIVRGTVGSPPGPSMAAISHALASPTLEQDFAERVALMKRRWAALRAGLASIPASVASPRPFNAAFFALLDLRPGTDVDQVRQRLLAEERVGVISFNDLGALRVAFCSLHEDEVPELITRLSRVLTSA